MLKAADALAFAGHAVHVVSTNHTAWATAADAEVKKSRPWSWSVVDYDSVTGSSLRVLTGARGHAMRAVVSAVGPSRVPLAVAIRAYARAHDELVREATARPADLIYGGTTGAIAAVAAAAARMGVPYGVDFEDLHSGEQDGPGSELTNALADLDRKAAGGDAVYRTGIEVVTRLVNPIAPHIAEEVWQMLGYTTLLVATPWPEFDPALLEDDVVTIAVQVNGKLRGTISVAKGADKAACETAALSLPAVPPAALADTRAG